MLALGNENSEECLVRFYDMHPNYIYRDEIKKIENMLLYFHFPFAPLLTVVGFRVYRKHLRMILANYKLKFYLYFLL